MEKYLFKASNDGISFCRCEDAPASLGGQLDCPWCGCGFLFSCHSCRLAFTFAEVSTIETPLEDLIRKDLVRMGLDPDDRTITGQARWIRQELAHLSVGQRMVYLDGALLPVDRPVNFNGIYARHDFPMVPHLDPEMFSAIKSRDYWDDARH